MVSMNGHHDQGFLSGMRVLELADELGEHAGRLLAGLGADVVKIEPPGGESTRGYGPFFEDRPGPERSLYFWTYNFGKRSVVLDLDTESGREALLELAAVADVIIDGRPKGYLAERGLGYETLSQRNPGLILTRISPFGDEGPWSGFSGSDLVHLALGGVMMNCGYDPTPLGDYDTPPVAPQMWQAYQITGELAVIQTLVALNYRLETGQGQAVSVSVHEAVSANTETDVPDWIYTRLAHARQTSRHSIPAVPDADGRIGLTVNPNARTKDGRWVLAYRTYLEGFGGSIDQMLSVLRSFDAEEDLANPKYAEQGALSQPANAQHLQDVINRMVGGFTFDRDVWRVGQQHGMTWAPVRKPHECLGDEHWWRRGTFARVEYPEIDRVFEHAVGRWFAPGIPWRQGPRAPLVDEHRDAVPPEWAEPREVFSSPPLTRRTGRMSPHGRPFALDGIRVIDLSWMLASAGAGRFLAAHGAEVIKVEHRSRLDGMRLGVGVPPAGGRAERDEAAGPLVGERGNSVNRSGAFGEINAGKLGLSLNLKTERGKELLAELIRGADIVVEGFSPGTMERMGFGYERLKQLNPAIIYVQQSGMGQHGTFGQFRSFGPTAQAFSGLTEMSGLPEPYAPAGIGYSYLDWVGAYQMATAMLAALARRSITGEGCWIDSSQTEAGIYLTGTAMLEHVANGKPWSRYGNRSPYKEAAPSGAYPTAGEDRWIAISVFTDEHWHALVDVLGITPPPGATDSQWRADHQDDIDVLVGTATRAWDGYELMHALQKRGVPAGVCQTAEDRVDRDPQLTHDQWLVELPHSEIGTWPVRELAGCLSRTPSYIGGALGRHAPNYGEDTADVLARVLAMSADEIAAAEAEGAL